MKGQYSNIILLAFLFFLAACSGTGKLKPGETLYGGAKINTKLKEKADKKDAKAITPELKSLVRPVPNLTFKVLGLTFRPKLSLWNLIGTPRKAKGGIRRGLRNLIGEPPVLASELNLEKNRQIIENRLENRGFFGSSVLADTVVKKKVMTAVFDADLSPRYHIASVTYPTDSSDLGKAIQSIRRGSRLKVGNPYDLDVIKDERLRIDTRLKNKGFFYFNENDIIVNYDSTIGDNKVDLVVEVKKETPSGAKNIYKINDVVVYADYSLESDTGFAGNVENFEGYKIIDPEKKYKPTIFSRTLVFHPGDLYKRNDHNLSLSRLVDLGVFKFVKVRFEEPDTVKGNLLNAYYYLTPVKKKSVRAEVSALTKSNNTNGTELTLSWRNRNMFRGAELFTVSAFGGFEKQISGQSNVSTLRFGGDLNLYVPRIISPFKFKTNSQYVPKTRANLGFEVFDRNTQYTLNSYKASFGYIFKDDITKEHQLNIISINYVKPTNITPEYQLQLLNNITLQRSIERQFIIGSTYNYNVNTLAKPNRKKNNYYFNGNVDWSGNILGLVTGADVDKGKQKMILAAPFSQYVRLELEGRHYFKLGTAPENIIASRLLVGMGYAYGNSNSMPFVKQFFIGGTNSIRAFRARSLGPGRFYGGRSDTATTFLPDQPGDIKIEVNTELRAKLISVVQGALFVDAGNIWMRREDPARPESKFTNKFLQDFAVGTGAGLRVDIKFLVLRLDVAFPIRKPYLVGGPRWVLNEIAFGDSQWRKENLVFNLAIGYPF